MYLWQAVPYVAVLSCVNVILAFLGGGCGTAIVAGIFGRIQWKLNRKAKKEDTAPQPSTEPTGTVPDSTNTTKAVDAATVQAHHPPDPEIENT